MNKKINNAISFEVLKNFLLSLENLHIKKNCNM